MPQGTLLAVPATQEGDDPRIVTKDDPLPIQIMDNRHELVNFSFHVNNGASTTLSAESAQGATFIDVVDATGFSAGDILDIGVEDSTHAEITSIASNRLTLDRPLDHIHPSGEIVFVIIRNLATTLGSLSSPISYMAQPKVGFKWHVNTLIVSLVHSSAGDDSKFGSISALTNGVILRGYHADTGKYHTFTNWKRNQDMLLDVSEMIYSSKSGGGLYGTHGNWLLRSIGVSVELNGTEGDFLEILIQDDITSLSSFLVKVQGYVEEIEEI